MATIEIDIASRQAAFRPIAAFARRFIVLMACLLPVASLAAPDVCPSGCEYSTITEAVDSKPGGTVTVGAGVYFETSIFLGSPLKASVLTSESPNDPTQVVIDGDGAGPVIIGSGTIIGITIRNAHSNANGGAISGSPTLQNCVLRDNTSDGHGGAIFSNSGGATMEITNCDFINNTAAWSGGAISFSGASLTIRDSKFESNHAGTPGGLTHRLGGALAFGTGNALIESTEFITNDISGPIAHGGAIGLGTSGVTTLNNVAVVGNRAIGDGATGGGLAILGSVTAVDVNGGSFANNTATGSGLLRGGGIYIGNSDIASVSIAGVPISGNDAAGGGGGVYCQYTTTLFALPSSVSGNTPNDTEGCDSSVYGTSDDPPANKEGSATAQDPVNTFTGDLFNYYPPDLNLGGPLPVSFSRYYAYALETANIRSSLGTNWRHNYAWTLSRVGSDVQIVSGDGRRITFTDNGATWNQVGGTDHLYQLEETGSGFTLTDMNSNLHRDFDISARFVALRDGFGNAHTLVYGSDGNLATISDGLGRTITLNHDANNHLASLTDGTRTVTFNYVDNNLVDVTDAMGNNTVYFYNPNANARDGLLWNTTEPEGNVPFSQTTFNKQVTSQTNADGHTFTFNYNGLTTTITDPNGDTRVHTHSADGEFTNREDQAGQSFSMGYDADGRRNSLTDRLGDTTTLSYHAPSGNIASVTNADGTTMSYAYTARAVGGVTLHDLTGITHADGTTESFVYDASGNLISSTDQAGFDLSGTYNALGQVLSATNVASGTATHVYNADGTRASTTRPAGSTTSYVYDALLRLSDVTLADLSTLSFTYDDNNNLLSTTDENGNVISLSYDSNDRLTTITDALLNNTSFGYDGNNRLLSTTYPLGGTTSSTFDSLGRVNTVTNENGNIVTLGYDILGRLTSLTDPLGNVSTSSYDAEAIIASSTDPLGNTTSFGSDQMGRITQVTSPLLNVSSLNYDAMGRVFAATDPLGNSTTFSREARGLLSGITLPGGAISTAYIRNAFGQITTITDPNGNNWNRAFDNSGRLTSITDPLGQTTSTAYDNRDRPSLITFPAVLGTQTLTYDAVGNPTSVSYSDGTALGFTYDANDRLTAANDGGATPDNVTRTYDANGRISNTNGIAVARDTGGRITSMTLAPGKAVTYAYDANDRVTSITDWDAGVTTFSYDNADRLTGITRPNGVNTIKTWDNDSRLTGLSEGLISSISLTRDAKGQITSAARNVPQAASASTLRSSVNSFDIAAQIVGNTYDALGRRTAAGADSFSWDLASRLESYTVGGATVTHTYDALGRRTSRTGGGLTREYVWNDALGLASISIEKEAGADLRYYIHTPGGALLFSMDATTDARSFYHFDETGNTIFITDDTGVEIGSYAYTPFGLLIASTGALDISFTWQGENGVMDESNGLYYVRARYYDANTGRFISRDPNKAIGPREVNPYQYALANPLSFVDVTGRKWMFVLRLKLAAAKVKVRLAEKRRDAAFAAYGGDVPTDARARRAQLKFLKSIAKKWDDVIAANRFYFKLFAFGGFKAADRAGIAGFKAAKAAADALDDATATADNAREAIRLHFITRINGARKKVREAQKALATGSGSEFDENLRKLREAKSELKRAETALDEEVEIESVIPELAPILIPI